MLPTAINVLALGGERMGEKLGQRGLAVRAGDGEDAGPARTATPNSSSPRQVQPAARAVCSQACPGANPGLKTTRRCTAASAAVKLCAVPMSGRSSKHLAPGAELGQQLATACAAHRRRRRPRRGAASSGTRKSGGGRVMAGRPSAQPAAGGGTPGDGRGDGGGNKHARTSTEFEGSEAREGAHE